MPRTSKAGAKTNAKGQKGPDKLPKRIAGTKVPKRVRRSGIWAGWVTSPLGRELIASALVAAAAAIAPDTGKGQSKKSASRSAKGAGSSRVAQAIAGAAIDMVGRGLSGADQAQPSSGDQGQPAPTDRALPKAKAGRKRKSASDTPTFTH